MENDQQPAPNEKRPLSLFQNPIEWNDEPVTIADTSVYLTIWYAPTDTFRLLLKAGNSSWVIGNMTILFILGGIIRSLNSFEDSTSLGVSIGFTGNLPLAVITGTLFGWIFFIIYAGLLTWTGNKLLGGNAEQQDYKIILAWSIVPMIVGFVFPLLRIFIISRYPSLEMVSYVTLIPEMVFSIWSIVILVIGISLIQSYSTFRAILNMVLPGVLFVAVLFGSLFLFKLAFGPHII